MLKYSTKFKYLKKKLSLTFFLTWFVITKFNLISLLLNAFDNLKTTEKHLCMTDLT